MRKWLMFFLIICCALNTLNIGLSSLAECPTSDLPHSDPFSVLYATYSRCISPNSLEHKINPFGNPKPVFTKTIVNYELEDLSAGRIIATAIAGGAIGLVVAVSNDHNIGEDVVKGATIGLVVITLTAIFD